MNPLQEVQHMLADPTNEDLQAAYARILAKSPIQEDVKDLLFSQYCHAVPADGEDYPADLWEEDRARGLRHAFHGQDATNRYIAYHQEEESNRQYSQNMGRVLWGGTVRGEEKRRINWPAIILGLVIFAAGLWTAALWYGWQVERNLPR